MGPLFDSVEDYGEMFQNSIAQTNQTGNPVVYKLVRVCVSQTVLCYSWKLKNSD